MNLNTTFLNGIVDRIFTCGGNQLIVLDKGLSLALQHNIVAGCIDRNTSRSRASNIGYNVNFKGGWFTISLPQQQLGRTNLLSCKQELGRVDHLKASNLRITHRTAFHAVLGGKRLLFANGHAQGFVGACLGDSYERKKQAEQKSFFHCRYSFVTCSFARFH